MTCRRCRKHPVSTPRRVIEWLQKALQSDPPASVVAALVDCAVAELLGWCSVACAVAAGFPLGQSAKAPAPKKRKAA